MIQQPWSRAVPGRFVSEIKPAALYAGDARSAVLVGSLLVPMQFANALSVLINAGPVVSLALYPVDATTVVLLTAPMTGTWLRLVNIFATLLMGTSLAGQQTYLGSIAQALYLSGWGVQRTPNKIGLRQGAETWVVNMETQAASQYDNFGFNSFAFDGTRYLAAADDGIYEMTGTTDDGTAISWLVQLAQTAFGVENRKALPAVWIGAKSATALVLKVEADGQTYTYTADRGTTTLENSRVDPGRGLEGTYWTFTLSNIAPAELERITFLPVPLSRRI